MTTPVNPTTYTGEAYNKAVITNRIIMAYTPQLYDKCKGELTYKIPGKHPQDKPYIKSTLRKMGERFISLPAGRLDLIPEGFNIVDKRANVPAVFPEFKFKLRPDQKEIYDLVEDSCLINANVSWGKTFSAIAIASKLGQKTLVITDTVNLRNQWEREVEKVLGIKPGVIGSGRLDYNECITISNIQTLRKHSKVLSKEFGLIIVDECHHVAAKVFEDTLNTFASRYKIGLSATLKRKDFLHIVLPDYFSLKVYVPKVANQMVPKVLMIKTGIPFNSNPMIPWANKVNELTNRADYLHVVTSLAKDAADAGHKVLVVSDRTEFLEKCHAKHHDISVLVHGAIKQEERDKRHKELEKDKNILYGALSMYKEGISINCLSCLILAAPTNNEPMLEQLIGRVLRVQQDKVQPLVVDLVLKGNTAKRQATNRAKHYSTKGYKVFISETHKISS